MKGRMNRTPGLSWVSSLLLLYVLVGVLGGVIGVMIGLGICAG